jgi:hypothetical protein
MDQDPPICVECGDDHATEGLLVCLECAEALGHEADQYRTEE